MIHRGLIAALAIYQHSFAAALGHDDVSLLSSITSRRVFTFGRPASGRSTWSIICPTSPSGMGLGQVVRLGKTTMNYFIEPQYSVAREGLGAPRWQIFGGVNFQFAMH